MAAKGFSEIAIMSKPKVKCRTTAGYVRIRTGLESRLHRGAKIGVLSLSPLCFVERYCACLPRTRHRANVVNQKLEPIPRLFKKITTTTPALQEARAFFIVEKNIFAFITHRDTRGAVIFYNAGVVCNLGTIAGLAPGKHVVHWSSEFYRIGTPHRMAKVFSAARNYH
jgi:hypothetical protein